MASIYFFPCPYFKVGTFPGGLASVKCCPDFQLVCAVTRNLEVILMTSEFDVLAQFPLEAVDSAADSVNVGWGSKATQFHGKAGKEAAKAVSAPAKPADPRLDDSSVAVEWTEDGETFAISHVSQQDGVRRIRFFDREGTLLHISGDF